MNFIFIIDWEEKTCCKTIRKKSEPNANIEHGVIVLSMLSTYQQVSELYHHGCIEFETIVKATNILIEANKALIPLVQQCLVKRVTKLVQEKDKAHAE